MFRFECPTCRKRLKAPERAAGKKIDCPKCGQRLEIPHAPIPTPKKGTVLGVLPTPIPTTESVSLLCQTCKREFEYPADHVGVGKPILCPRCGRQVGCAADEQETAYASSPAPQLAENREDDSAESDAELVLDITENPRRRSWRTFMYSWVSVILGVTALPLAMSRADVLLGVLLTGAGCFVGILAIFRGLGRREPGVGLSLLGTAICVSMLYLSVLLQGGLSALVMKVKGVIPAGQDNQGSVREVEQRQTESAWQGQPKRWRQEEEDEPEIPKRQRSRQEDEPVVPKGSSMQSPVVETVIPKRNGGGKAIIGQTESEKPSSILKFDSNNLERTVNWMAIVISKLRDDEDNPIRLRKHRKQIEDELAIYVNKKVNWSLSVLLITETRVSLASNYNIHDVSVSLTQGGWRGIELLVGRDIHAGKAEKLRVRDHVTIKATIVNIIINSSRQVTITLKDVHEKD